LKKSPDDTKKEDNEDNKLRERGKDRKHMKENLKENSWYTKIKIEEVENY